MLLKIREIVTGWLAAAIIVLLIIPFAFWGINYYFGNGSGIHAIEVNGTPISLMEYQRAYQNLRQRWVSTYGTFTEDQEPALKQNTIDSLVDRELIRQTNEDLGVRVGDIQLTEVIMGQTQFQGVNGFDSYMYEQALAQMGYTKAGFEDQMRRDFEALQFQGAVYDSVFVTREQRDRLIRILNQERDFVYGIISSNDLKESISVSDDDIDKLYRERSQDFMNPEQVRIAYVDLSMRAMAAALQVSEDQFRAYYDENKALYEIEDQRKFMHLFAAIAEDAGDDEVAVLTAKIQAVREQILSGKSMEEAVAAVSNGDTNDMEVIDQDYITRGILEPEIDDVLFSMNIGDVSEPIRTGTGLNLIVLDTIRGGTSTSFESVREQVEEDYRKAQVEPEYVDKLDQMTNLAFEHPDTLDFIADELGLTVYESAFFDRQWQENELLRNPAIVNASFSEDVLLAGNNSEPIAIDDDRYIVLRVVDHKPEQQKPLDEVRDRIITRIKFERARDAIREQGQQAVDSLKTGTDRDQVAGANGFQWQPASGVQRGDPEIDNSILDTAFRLGHPRQGQTVAGGNSLASGDYAVIILEQVKDGDPAQMTEEQVEPLMQRILQLTATDSWEYLLNDLKTSSKIKVYSDNL